MKKILVAVIAALTIAVCLSLTACTMKLSDPAIPEDAELDKVQVMAENGTWHELEEEQAERLFNIVKSRELSSEAFDIAISGSSTIETTFDYTFKIAFTTGNFFLKKKGEFTYNVGERFKRTYSDGRESERITEDKLVVMRSLSKDTATLTSSQLQMVEEIFEPVNSMVMDAAFAKIPEGFKDSSYTVEEIPSEELASTFYSVFTGTPFNGEQNLVKGYKITGISDESYVFMTSSVDWIREIDGKKGITRVGRVCYSSAGSCAGRIEEILKS